VAANPRHAAECFEHSVEKRLEREGEAFLLKRWAGLSAELKQGLWATILSCLRGDDDEHVGKAEARVQ